MDIEVKNELLKSVKQNKEKLKNKGQWTRAKYKRK